MWIISAYGLFLLILHTFSPATADVSHLTPNGINNQFYDHISLLRNAIRGEPNIDYPIYSHPPATSFTCAGRHDGYYADTETRCQVFRVCANTDTTGHGFAFLCPNGTLFNQRHFVCDWHYNVDCNESPSLYFKNEQLGKRIESHDQMMTMVRYMQNFVMQSPSLSSQSGSSSAFLQGSGGSSGSTNFGAALGASSGGVSFGQGFGDSSSSATNFGSHQTHQKIYVSNLGELSTEPGSGFDLSKSNIISHNLDFHQSSASSVSKGPSFSSDGHSKLSSQPFHGKFNAVFSGSGNLIGLGSNVQPGGTKFSGSDIKSNAIYLPPRPSVPNTYIPPHTPVQNTYVPPASPQQQQPSAPIVSHQINHVGNTGSTQKFPSFPGNLVTTPPRVSIPTQPPATTTVVTSRIPSVEQPTTEPKLDIRFGDDDDDFGNTPKLSNTPSKYFSLPLSPVEIKERELKKLGLVPRKQEVQDSAKEGSAVFPQRIQFPTRFDSPALPLTSGYSTTTTHIAPATSRVYQSTLYQAPQAATVPQATSFSSRFSSHANDRATDIQIIPARGYYFNDPSERKLYYDDVARGLFNDHGNGYVYIKPKFSALQDVPTVAQHHEIQHSGVRAAPLKVLEARDTEGSIFRGFDSYAAPLSHVGQLPTDTVYNPAQSHSHSSFQQSF